MIYLYHINDIIVEVESFESKVDFIGKNINESILSLININYDGWIGLINYEIQPLLDKTYINSKLSNQNIFLNIPFATNNEVSDFSFIYFSSPSVVPLDVSINASRICSELGVIFHSKILNLFNEDLFYDYSFNWSINYIVFSLYDKGLISLNDSKLLKKTYFDKNYSKLSNKFIYHFICNHTKISQRFIFYVSSIFFNNHLFNPFYLFTKQRDYLLTSSLNILTSNIKSSISKNPSIDVVIPTIGREKYLLSVLKDLNNQDLIPVNVIIVEQLVNNSSNNLTTNIYNLSLNFKIIYIKTNKIGACHARNLALEQVTSEWVYFADDDIKLLPHTLSSVLDQMFSYNIEVANIAVYQDGQSIIPEVPKLSDFFSSGSALVKSSIIQDLRFDLNFEHGFGEDSDFGIQIRKKGFPIYYISICPIFHFKAPIGGFRIKAALPWDSDSVIPKPSPTILYHFKKNLTEKHLMGYKVFFFLNHMKLSKNPLILPKLIRQWNSSLKWADYLLSRNP